MKKISLKELFDNNRFVQIFSIVAAAFCWLLVAMTQSYTTVEIIRQVPVKIDAQSSALTSIGLQPIISDDIFVDVEVEGLRSVVGRITPEELAVTAKVTGVTEAAVYDLWLTSTNQSPNPDYTIKSFSPSTVKVKFDRIDRRSFKIKEEINGLAIAPGYTEKTTVITPDTINIEGPSTELAKISRCVIKTELTAPLDKTYSADCPIILYNENGDVLDPGEMNLTLERTDAQLTIRVLKITNLPLEVDFLNIPRGFPVDELMSRVSVSQLDVTIAGPGELIDKASEIKLGYLDISKITPEQDTFPFDVQLPSPADQFMRLDNVTSVAVRVDTRDLTSAVFNVQTPRLINVPAGFTVELLANSIPQVTLVGKPEILASLTADDIVAEIDMSERVIVNGSYPFPVKISVPDKGLVWAIGDHSVTIQVNETVS